MIPLGGMMPTLYIVATPIGNMEDITLRALRILDEVSLIAAEDTRKTGKLLSAFGIKTPLTSYHEHNKISRLPSLLEHLGRGDVALVSEAGMPGISDPGYELVVAAIGRGIRIEPIPGASVLVTALAVSGLPTDQFVYIGFLPRRKGQRRELLQGVEPQRGTIIAFEAPHRLAAALGDILDVLGDRRIAVCRELTKMYEEVFRGTVSGAIDHFHQPIGEFTLVIQGKPEERPVLADSMIEELRRLKGKGVAAKEAVARISGASGVSKKEIYRAWLRLG
jgi:16S rRNA (cytidine1402-2'-O)-methyltransferase